MHPYISHCIASLGIGVLSYYAAKLALGSSVDPEWLVLGSATLSACTYPYIRSRHYSSFLPLFIDTVICCPEKIAVSYNNFSYQCFESAYSVLKKGGTLEQAQDHALSLIKQQILNSRWLSQQGECIQEGDWAACKLSRTYDPSLRARFEESISNKILEIFADTKESVNIVSFASGGGFGDIRILLETLRRNTQAKINLSIIDIQCSGYTHTRNLLGLNPTIKTSEKIKLKDVAYDASKSIENIVRATTSQRNDFQDMTDEREEQIITLNWLEYQIKYQELLYWMSHTFPDATFELQVFGNCMEYINFLKEKPANTPHIIQGVDFSDQVSVYNDSILDYRTLVAYGLAKTNNTCFNLCLNKDNKPYLVSITLRADQNSHVDLFVRAIENLSPKRLFDDQLVVMGMDKDDFKQLIDNITDFRLTYL